MKRFAIVLVAALAVILLSAQLEGLPDWASQLPPQFQNTFLKIRLWQWGGIGAITVAALLGGLVARSLARRLTSLRDRYSPSPMADGARQSISKAAAVLGGSALAYALLPDLNLRPALERHLELVLAAIAALGGIWMLSGWWDAICDNLATRSAGNERAERLLIPVARKLIRAVIVSAGILIGIGIFGGMTAITSLLATLGLGGVVVALAAKDSVENLFGSFTILFDMPFALGDWVRIDKVEGAVEEINLRSTRIRTAEDTMITLPNANLIRASVENFGARRIRRQRVFLRVSLENPAEAIKRYCEALRGYVQQRPDVLLGAIVELNDPQEQSIGVLLQFNLDVVDYPTEMRVRHETLLEAVRLAKDSGVKLGPTTAR